MCRRRGFRHCGVLLTMPVTFQVKRVFLYGLRPFAVLCVVLALLAPLAYTFVSYWRGASDDLEFAQAERQGVVYLRPMSRLVAAIADGQSAAVAGRRPAPRALAEAVVAVAEADRTVGGGLRVHDSWVDLQTRLAELAATPRTGKSAYEAYSEAMDVALFLMLRVGDTSKLILDPEIDSYYLMDAGMLRLPLIMADSGRMTDLEVMRGQGGELPLARVLVARDRVGTAASAVKSGLAKSFASSASRSIGKDLLGKIDAFHAALEPMAPTVPLVDQPLPPRAALMEARRATLVRAALELNTAALDQLDQLLVTRERDLQESRFVALIVLVAGLVLAIAALAWGTMAPRNWKKGEPKGTKAGPGHPFGSADTYLQGNPEAEGPPDAIPPSRQKHGRHTRKKAAGAPR